MSAFPSPGEVLAHWSLADLDTLHAYVGLGPEWLASERRAELAAYDEERA